jgi:hypothetical protein
VQTAEKAAVAQGCARLVKQAEELTIFEPRPHQQCLNLVAASKLFARKVPYAIKPCKNQDIRTIDFSKLYNAKIETLKR